MIADIVQHWLISQNPLQKFEPCLHRTRYSFWTYAAWNRIRWLAGVSCRCHAADIVQKQREQIRGRGIQYKCAFLFKTKESKVTITSAGNRYPSHLCRLVRIYNVRLRLLGTHETAASTARKWIKWSETLHFYSARVKRRTKALVRHFFVRE